MPPAPGAAAQHATVAAGSVQYLKPTPQAETRGVPPMAPMDFLQHLRTAHSLFAHRVHPNHTRPGSRKSEVDEVRTAVWLTPSSVKGFNVHDFPQLSPEARDRLKANVDRFLKVARQVPPPKLPTVKQVKEAETPFREVLKILKPHVVLGDEDDPIYKVLKGVSFPSDILTWEYEVGLDWTDDPAVWIWMIVDDASPEKEGFYQRTWEVEEKIREALSAAGVARWPYFRMRTGSEQRAL
jgi:hypothetical protein